MQDISGSIRYRDHDYRIVFNLNVMEQIQDKYGTMEKWGELTDGSGGEPNAAALKFGFWAMLNEGIEMDNEDNGSDTKPLTLNKVGRMISEIGLGTAAIELNKAVVASTKMADDTKKE